MSTTQEKKYAIIQTGGKQYRVAEGDTVDVECLAANEGERVNFGEVLFMYDGSHAEIGTPNITGCVVVGEVVGMSKGPKLRSLKYTARKHNPKNWGHRQHYQRVLIKEIVKKKEKEHGA